MWLDFVRVVWDFVRVVWDVLRVALCFLQESVGGFVVFCWCFSGLLLGYLLVLLGCVAF